MSLAIRNQKTKR